MKLLLPPALVLALSACAANSGIEQVRPSKDATSLALGNVPADQVAQCIGAAFGVAPQSNGGTGYSLAVPALANGTAMLRIDRFDDPLNRFITKVEVVGQIGGAREEQAVVCVGGNSERPAT